MEQHKYLEDIGLKRDELPYNLLSDDGVRNELWESQKADYGFDERETWCLDHTFICWLYERLMMYKDIGGKVVDLSFHKFTFDGVEMTQLECIDKMIELSKYLLTAGDEWDHTEEYRLAQKELIRIWAAVLPAMWW